MSRLRTDEETNGCERRYMIGAHHYCYGGLRAAWSGVSKVVLTMYILLCKEVLRSWLQLHVYDVLLADKNRW